MTELVIQRTTHDCSPCCLAMALELPYDQIISLAGKDFDPEKGMWSVQGVLERAGLSHAYENGHPVGDFVQRHRGYEISAAYFRDLAWGRRALLSVPSLNFGGHHMVFFDGRKVWDPSPLKTYTDFSQLLPDELVLFRERG
jgi:hypothetical protein